MATRPEMWWLYDRGLEAVTAAAAAYGTQYLQQYGVPDISRGVELLGAAKGLHSLSKNLSVAGAVAGVTTGTVAYSLGKVVGKRHLKSYKPKEGKEFRERAWEAATFASHSYKHQDDRKSFGNWSFMKHRSTDRMTIHERRTNGDWHISIRGSDFGSPGRSFTDLANDMYITMGSHEAANMFGETTKRLEHLIKVHANAHPNGRIFLSGHSLGGSMVAHMMQNPVIAKYVTEAHSFNPGIGPFQQGWKGHGENMHIHLNAYDPVSIFANTDSGATIHQHSGELLNAHWNDKWEKRSYWRDWAYDKFTLEDETEIAAEI